MNIEKFLVLIVAGGLLVAFGGATHPLSLGVFLAFLGLWCMVSPPRAGIHGAAGFCWWGLLAWIVLSLWWGGSGVEWREEARHLGIPLGPGASPQPWVTVEALLPFFAGSAWFCLALSNIPRGRDHTRSLYLLASILAVLGAVAIWLQAIGMRLPWADHAHVFSWFPNRNQTALVFACGSVLVFGLGLDSMRSWSQTSSGKRVSFVAGGCFLAAALLLYAVLQTLSKGAFIAWSGGLFFLLAVLWKSGSKIPWWRSAAVALLLFFSLFAFFGGDGRDRFVEFLSPSEDVEVSADFRMQIYQDGVVMVRDQPIFGTGLGQFQYVFPQYRESSASPVTVLHPESDWVWWAAELGLPGLLVILAGIVFLLLRLKLWSGDESDCFRRKVVFAALLPFLIHSFVDVGAHRLGTVAVAALLYALALPRNPDQGNGRNSPSRLAGIGISSPLLWRASGGVLFALGISTAVLASLQSPRLSAFAHTSESPSLHVPLQWEPYFTRAVRYYREDPRMGRADFRRARFLQPHATELPLQEGRFLLRLGEPGGAFSAFRVALMRSPDPEETFREILARTSRHSEHHSRLYALADGDPKLLALYWASLPREFLLSEAGLPQALFQDWDCLKDAGRARVLQRLLRIGENEAVRELYQLRSTDAETLWPFEIRAMAAVKEWSAALDLFHSQAPSLSLPEHRLGEQELLRLQARYLQSRDLLAGKALLQAYLSRRAWREARRLTAELVEGSHVPSAVFFWAGWSAEQEGRLDEAVSMYIRWMDLEGIGRFQRMNGEL